MARVKNNSARQFNLKCVGKGGQIVSVRVLPGVNVVDDAHWEAFVSKDGKSVDPYVAQLKDQGLLSFGDNCVPQSVEPGSEVKAQSKSVVNPKVQVKKVEQ